MSMLRCSALGRSLSPSSSSSSSSREGRVTLLDSEPSVDAGRGGTCSTVSSDCGWTLRASSARTRSSTCSRMWLSALSAGLPERAPISRWTRASTPDTAISFRTRSSAPPSAEAGPFLARVSISFWMCSSMLDRSLRCCLNRVSTSLRISLSSASCISEGISSCSAVCLFLCRLISTSFCTSAPLAVASALLGCSGGLWGLLSWSLSPFSLCIRSISCRRRCSRSSLCC
mmetsp:Transcript_3188/g.5523  ORF Transcript_3188/g.5523 Transcript_3188/m.5523 type:complete len:229 (+) Transcript_3188:614-1300(+)